MNLQLQARLLILMLAGSLLTACSGGDKTAEQTVIAQHGTLSTEIVIRRQTATFAADQLRVTAEYYGTEARSALLRSTGIASTLQALGMAPGSIAQITPVILSPTPRAGSQMDDSGTPGGITRIPPTPEAPEGTPTTPPPAIDSAVAIDPTLPNMTDVSVSDAVGEDDCATNPAASFPTTSTTLYAVGTANLFPAGTTVTFSWLKDGQPVFSTDWTWDDAVDGKCIWYSFTPEDFPFDPGSYTLNFELGGGAIAQPVNFTLVDEASETP